MLQMGNLGRGKVVDVNTEESNIEANVENLVEVWLTGPDFAEVLGTTPKVVRSALADDRVVGIKRGKPKVLMIPQDFLIPWYMANPADQKADDGSGKQIILPSLRGTVIALRDAQLDDAQIIEWLFSVEDSLGERPIDVLKAGNKSAVRRATQSLLW